MFHEKNLFSKKYLKSNNQETFQALPQIQVAIRLGIDDSKKIYYERQINFRMISLMENVIGQFQNVF